MVMTTLSCGVLQDIVVLVEMTLKHNVMSALLLVGGWGGGGMPLLANCRQFGRVPSCRHMWSHGDRKGNVSERGTFSN